MTEAQTLIIGIGNRYRGDDALGCIVADELSGRVPPDVRCIAHDGEPAALIDCWQGSGRVMLIDAVSSGEEPGHIFRFDLACQALPEEFNLYSSHAFGVAQAVELARALHKLPPEISFIGVECENFDAGQALSPALQNAKDEIVDEILVSLAAKDRRYA